MAIPEAQLETWSHQGPTPQFTSTYDTLRGVLQSKNAPYANRKFTVFLQGSYANDTNIYADSDVDVVIRLDEVFYTDLEALPAEDRALYDSMRSAADYTLADFKSGVLAWLIENYGASVKAGSKAISIVGSGSRRDADVIVAAEFRRYRKFRGWTDQEYVEGICFFASSGIRIENFPKQHSENCTTKHQETDSWFKRTARVHKNLRNRLIENGAIEDGLAPSYYLEGLLYNVPKDRFGGGHVPNFKDTLQWLLAADRSKFVCANEQFYLLREGSPMTWRAAKCQKFLDEAYKLWNNW